MYFAILSLHVVAGIATLMNVVVILLGALGLYRITFSRFMDATHLMYLGALQITSGAILALTSDVTALSLCDNLLVYSALVAAGIFAAERHEASLDISATSVLTGSIALFAGAVVFGA